MSRRDRLEEQIELALEPGNFIGYRDDAEFIEGLDDVERVIAALVPSQPVRAADLYETFIAGCHEKADEVDGSSGSFGMFVESLLCGWVKARQAADAAADETARTLMKWMDEDPYGFCHGIEAELVKVLDRSNLAAFEQEVRKRFEAAPAKTDASGYQSYPRCHWGDVLRSTCAARGDVEAYLAVCEGTRLGSKDCLAVATMLCKRRKDSEALTWVERGLSLDKGRNSDNASVELEDLKRELLKKLGRGEEALQSAWKEFEGWPHEITYEKLMRYVPKKSRAEWHTKAIDAAAKAHLRHALLFLVEHKEIGRLAERVRQAKDTTLEDLSHYQTEPAARALEKPEPVLAARIYRALGVRILKAGKSKYYGAALSHFEAAKRCYERAGHPEEWAKVVELVRTEHYRKQGFVAGFLRIGKGATVRKEQTFLERAKTKWRNQATRNT